MPEREPVTPPETHNLHSSPRDVAEARARESVGRHQPEEQPQREEGERGERHQARPAGSTNRAAAQTRDATAGDRNCDQSTFPPLLETPTFRGIVCVCVKETET